MIKDFMFIIYKLIYLIFKNYKLDVQQKKFFLIFVVDKNDKK